MLSTFGRDILLNSFEITTSEQADAGLKLNILYWLVAVPFLSGATNFYTYRSLTENQVTASDAFSQAKRRLLPLILVNFLSVVVVLLLFALARASIMWSQQSFAFLGLSIVIISGCYVLYRLMFSSYAIVIDNSSVPDSFDSSWKLTEGRSWLIVSSYLLIAFVFFVPGQLIDELIGLKLGNPLASQLVGQVLGFIVGVLINVYFILLYQRLRQSAAATQ
ncbi:hypothetical protein [Microcoleus sp. K5-D4]|uniref:hypothetical protein n=1 Tax=Microcoleus sp. K5-D4 TaxID=2818801 RepID=UPI002FD37564